MNEGNLKRLTHAQAVEQGRKGGVKSGEARRLKKTLRESLKILLELPETDPERLASLAEAGIEEGNRTLAASLAATVIEKAIAGDLQAAIFIRDTVGEKPELSIKGKAALSSKKSKIIIYKP